jgi:hypothetical protein
MGAAAVVRGVGSPRQGDLRAALSGAELGLVDNRKAQAAISSRRSGVGGCYGRGGCRDDDHRSIADRGTDGLAVASRCLERFVVESLINVVHCVSSHEFLYVFGWLLPLGAVRLGCLPRPWVLASTAAALVALVLGASVDAHGNVARAMFDVAGPMLSLSVAMLIGRTSDPQVNAAV